MYMFTCVKKFLPLMMGYFLPVALGIIPLKEKNTLELPVQISFNYKGIENTVAHALLHSAR